ncbi:MAG TPA: DNA mismatch repair endonuclease MutL [Firmicutes bacterium]|nr:DNA mismatch repair endonuclease MutL [Bacillota bacterium]
MSIKKLPPATANQIAAGEVVSGPSSVVKELVENALDAGAKRIRVLLKKGGLGEVTVIDDGCGISPGELRMAIQRHATSKIRNLEDLQDVLSLGFRGEALPSIASISKMSITSRQSGDEAGTRIYLEAGIEKGYGGIGFPVGTKVTVKSLFFNTPARRKFLKGIPAETAKISRIMQTLALSRPEVFFSLERERGILWSTAGDGNLKNTILTLFGHGLCGQLIPLHFREKNYYLHGYVSDPLFFRSNRRHQFFFVNDRAIQSRLLSEALDKSYSGLVTSKKFPMAFLFFDLPPDNLDVNVHPAKTEIRFTREEDIRAFWIKSLQAIFQKGRKIPAYNLEMLETGASQIREQAGTVIPPKKERSQRDLFSPGEGIYRNNKVEGKELHDPSASRVGIPEKEREGHIRGAVPSGKATFLGAQLPKKPFYDSIVGQAFGTYIILQKGEDLLFMDQHAAHERILWERIQQRESNAMDSSQLALPLPFELPGYLAEGLPDKIKLLEEIGLELEQFGDNTFIIRGVPIFLKDAFQPEMLLEFFEKLDTRPLRKENLQKEALLQLSCKAAVKAHKNLSLEEIESLTKQLEKCRDPFFCPHGRPVFFQMSKAQLEKFFKRR